MALPTLSYLVGLLVVAYLGTFVVFAIIRAFTGVSIRRLGLSSLRRISYSPRDGIKFEIRGFGLQVHRPTFAQPTWLSIVVSELQVTVDPFTLGANKEKAINAKSQDTSAANGETKHKSSTSRDEHSSKKKRPRGMLWDKLNKLKEKFKKFHRIICWLRLVDFVAKKSTFLAVGVGTLQVGSVVVSVDTRPKTVDRTRLFQHSTKKRGLEQPAEWTLALQNVHFTAHGKDSTEVLDHFVLNVHGFLYQDLEGLRDASLALKVGRLHIPYEDMMHSIERAREAFRDPIPIRRGSDAIEPTSPQSPETPMTEDNPFFVVSGAREFITSILRGIQEVSVAISSVAVSIPISFVRPAGMPVYINMSLKELGIDMYRLDPSSPAHSMYFSRRDVAHQALFSAISISIGVDDGHTHPERLLYIPMTTTTVKTTLPSKLLQFSNRPDNSDRNSNVVFVNAVVTSPSVDMDPRHLPLVLAILENRPRSSSTMKQHGYHMVSRFLPRAVVKWSVHEPVVRVALPPVEPPQPDDFDFDLIISAISSISLEVDSSHLSDSENHYCLTSTLRVASHRLYYQSTSRKTHDLLLTESMELKAHLTTSPALTVVGSANFQTFSLFMVRPEICEGVRQIVQQLRTDVKSDKLRHAKTSRDPNFLRSLPKWLTNFSVQASDFNLEIAGSDSKLSPNSRGFAVHLESCTTDYKSQQGEEASRPTSRRRSASRSVKNNEALKKEPLRSLEHNTSSHSTDGRRVAIHFRGLESFVIESTGVLEPEPFISLPRSEIAFTTANDGHSPILHINSYTKAAYLQYSLFKHYALGVATTILRKTFAQPPNKTSESFNLQNDATTAKLSIEDSSKTSSSQGELITVDIRASFIQIKARMPADPAVMLHLTEFDAARHRWTTPYVRAAVARFYAEAPIIKTAWTRIVSIKSPRLDIREGRRKQHGSTSSVERTFDFVSEAIRIGVPHQFVVHKLFDNFVNSAKTIAQLHHRFKTDSNEYILAKNPVGPKHVPKISFRTRVLHFEIEDGAFEWKLGVIYRTGLVEQKQRLARDAAFRLKSRKLERNSSVPRARSRSPLRKRNGRSPTRADNHENSSRGPSPTGRASSPYGYRGRNMRYDRDGTCGFTTGASTSIQEAWDKLQRYNAQSWKKRIDAAKSRQTGAVQELRSLFWGSDELPEDVAEHETILAIPRRPALMSVLMSDFNVTIDKPSFPLSELPTFMHDYGKCLPKDTQFGLLIPLNAQFELGEVHVSLRDYPLPLLHIPAIKPGQSPRLSSWSVKTDFVIAEEFRDSESTRDLPIMVVPPEKMGKGSGGFAIDVRRTVSPVKMYSSIQVDINTARDTRFTWGASYQPAIQDMMQVIEGFTKPQIDPSERLGFWDKLRLNFHSRLRVSWKGDGDVLLTLKGTRDPYIVTGEGAGFVMVWRNDIQWDIWQGDDCTRFTTVDSGDFVLAIPDFSAYARNSPGLISHATVGSSFYSHTERQSFKKVIMKLSGKVRWSMGLVFERTLEDGTRSFEFEPHYNVTLKNPIHVKEIEGQPAYDAFRGFRSNSIHMSISISAPHDRDWSLTNVTPAANYNSVHLTPRFFTHFFSWWAMFSGIMSLPIRQGTLFPLSEKTGKKFSRHLATIKYSLLLSPLFISHVYKHKDAEEFAEDSVAATGLKARLDSFMLDAHQRREEFDSEVTGIRRTVKTSGMRLNQALLDLVAADIRAVSAGITGTSAESINQANAEKLAHFQENPTAGDLSKFDIPDNDFSWIDVDDFVEVDWTLPMDSDPETKILPLAFAPRFTYRRHTDHHGTISGDPHRHSPFGYEDTHYCVITSSYDSRQVQIDLLKERLSEVDCLLQEHRRTTGEKELQVIRDAHNAPELQESLDQSKRHSELLERKKRFLNKMIGDLHRKMHDNEENFIPKTSEPEEYDTTTTTSTTDSIDESHTSSRANTTASTGLDAVTFADHITEFNNRFVIHNAQIKWNNSLRNIILRYLHQVSQRRGFVYYLSRRAVKFILDIVEEQTKATGGENYANGYADGDDLKSPDAEDDTEVQDRIEELLNDGRNFVNADDPKAAEGGERRNAEPNESPDEDVGQEFTAQNTYHLRLVAPQIQLQSEKNTKAAVLLTARGMRLKVVQIMDKDRVFDEVSGLVQRRFAAEMDNVQFFVTNKQLFSKEFFHMYCGNRYGSPAGSSWPPWVPVEAMFDFGIPSYGFSRVVERTSLSLRYDKYNTLRLKYNDNVTAEDSSGPINSDTAENRMDHLWVDFPKLRAICDSTEYYTMYIIVIDLLLWSEPLEKCRNERLEKIMLASDFSDLRGAPEMVTRLQDRIHQLQEIKTHFHVNEKDLDRQGWADRIAMEQDLTGYEDELFFMMKAIMTSQRKDDRKEPSQVNGILRWYLSASEIVWHLIKEVGSPLVEFQLAEATYERTDNSDGSNQNSVRVNQIRGLNLLPKALYPEIIAPYMDPHKAKSEDSDVKMVHIDWLMLEAIAGIPVVDHFEINLFPLKVQLEYETGKKLFEYIFPGAGNGEDGFSPFMVRHQLPEEDGESSPDTRRAVRKKSVESSMKQTAGSATGAGSLETRLQPTFQLPDYSKPANKHQGLGISLNESGSKTKLLAPAQSRSRPSIFHLGKLNDRQSSDNASIASRGRESSRSRNESGTATPEVEKPKRFSITKPGRSASRASNASRKNSQKQTDDLNQMLSRASNYMTLAYAKIPSVVLCLSYKGRGNRNFEDVHNLVFRMPTLEYRNKTWSNLDLALALKKDVIRALISHTGAIIGNKFTHHKPGKAQQSRLRELASSSVMLSSDEVSHNPSTASSLRNLKMTDSDGSPHPSDAAEGMGTLSRQESYASTHSGMVATPEEVEPPEDRQVQPVTSQDSSKDGSQEGKFFRQTLSRGLSELTQRARRRESTPGEEGDDSTTPKKVGLKKKILQFSDRS